MWNRMKTRLKDGKGFTLVEMLIVVAIIGILIAVSIPVVNNALEKTRDATDDANFRAAAALGSIKYLSNPESAAGTYYYFTNKASQGELFGTISAAGSDYTAYKSKCETDYSVGGANHSATGTSKGKYIKVIIASTGAVTVSWDANAPS